MNDISNRLSRTLWVGIGFLIVILCVSFVLSRANNRPHIKIPGVLGTISDFQLTNQLGQKITLADLRGHPWVGDIIFTRCSGPCPRMTRQLKSIQDELPAKSGVKLVTLTTDADFDTVPVLKVYADKYGADSNRWSFLTGNKKEIADLAANGLKLGSLPVDPQQRTDENDLWIHSTYFVLVDKQARLRAVFETSGEGIEWTNVQRQILANLKMLEREP